MSTKITPYIRFRTEARQAFEFYARVLGGSAQIASMGDFDAAPTPEDANLVMHAQIDLPNGFSLMGSDTPSFMEYDPGARIAVALHGGPEDLEEFTRIFDALAEKGQELQPLTEAPWGGTFGMALDAWGVQWMMNVNGAPRETEPAE